MKKSKRKIFKNILIEVFNPCFEIFPEVTNLEEIYDKIPIPKVTITIIPFSTTTFFKTGKRAGSIFSFTFRIITGIPKTIADSIESKISSSSYSIIFRN